MARYDRIGRTYAKTRRADPRIGAQIEAALGGASTILNVGAGTGNYEPANRRVVGLDPSMTMIRQRAAGCGPAVQGVADHLPFADDRFDAVMGTLTLHHWPDLAAGLAEVARVARRQVFLLFDVDQTDDYWLVDEYFPAAAALDHETVAPRAEDVGAHLDVRRVEVVPIPADCTDGFGCAFWNRPEAHLDPEVLAGMSWTAMIDPDDLRAGVDHLAADLASGEWDRRHGHLRDQTEADYGYRLVIAGT